MSHGHSHGGGCSCESEPSDAPERGLEYGLFRKIDLDKLQCLNESREGSGRSVFRAWEERNDRTRFVESDDDEELLFNIPCFWQTNGMEIQITEDPLAGEPFTGNVKLKGIVLIGEDSDTHPAELRLFKNVPHMSFDDTGREPDQTFSLNIDVTGSLEYPTKISRFSNVSHLSVHISKNFGAENTKIYYIGLRGEWTEAHRHEVTICNYEAAANPADHKVSQITPQTHFIS